MALPAPSTDPEPIPPEKRMRQLAHQLAASKKAVDEAKSAFSKAYNEWLEGPGKEFADRKDKYNDELAELEEEARKLVVQHSDAIPEGFFRLDDHTTVEIEDNAVEWLIYHAPFLAKELLVLDEKKLKSFLITNAIGKDERSLVPALAPVNNIVKLGIEKKPKIMWSALPQPPVPEEAATEPKEELKSEAQQTPIVTVFDYPERKRQVGQWAYDVINDENTIIIDTETTGLDTDTAEIVQFAAVSVTGEVLVDNLLIKPENGIPEAASRIHGITEDQVKDAVSFREAYETIAPVLKGKRVIIYNSGYDWPLIESLTKRNGFAPIETKSVECAMKKYGQWNGAVHRYSGDYKWHKLTSAASDLGIQVKDAHDALGDVVMTLALIKAIMNRHLEVVPF